MGWTGYLAATAIAAGVSNYQSNEADNSAYAQAQDQKKQIMEQNQKLLDQQQADAEQATQDTARRERTAAASRGLAANMLTGGTGDTSVAPVARKQLLGA